MQEAKSMPGPKRKCGITPVQNRLLSAGTTHPPVYDDEVDASSPFAVIDLDESQASKDIYCPLSPTIMSVHMPGSPPPQVSRWFDAFGTAPLVVDDAAPSVVIMGE